MEPFLSNIPVSSRIRSRTKKTSSTISNVSNNDMKEKSYRNKKESTKKIPNRFVRIKLLSSKVIESINEKNHLIRSSFYISFILILVVAIRHTLFFSFVSLEQNHIHPRTFVYHFDKTGKVAGFSKLDSYVHKFDHRKSKEAFIGEIQTYQLKSSRKYRRNFDGPFITKDCVQLYDWQLSSFPTCNHLHEVDMRKITTRNVQLISGGFWRNVWTQTEFNQKDKVVFKTLRFMHDFTHRNYERHRRDAVAMERLTKSPNVLNIFGHCGNSGLFEYGSHGDVQTAIWPGDEKGSHLSNLDLLRVAIQVCMAIVDVHTLEKEASIAHTDISPAQFIYIKGFYKLNDFNRCRFLRRNVTSNGICGFHVPNNPGKLRAPEEYKYEIENEKVDVFQMGHIFYMLLTQRQPFLGIEQNEVYEKVRNGELPELDEDIMKSEDVVHVTLRTAMNMCFTYNPYQRPSAKVVLDYLAAQYDKIDTA